MVNFKIPNLPRGIRINCTISLTMEILTNLIRLAIITCIPTNQMFAWAYHVQSFHQDEYNISHLLGKYFKQRIQHNYPEIYNLGDFITPFTSEHCLIKIDNPRQINLETLTNHPVLLRTAFPQILSSDNGEFIFNIYGPQNLAPRTLTVLPDRSMPCPFSSHFVPIRKSFLRITQPYASTFFCYHLSIPTFWKSI